jgi:prephenate dehydrogenase
MNRLCVLGFGLIGGSFALAQKRAEPTHVTAVDFAPVLAEPRAKQIADELVNAADEAATRAALREADLVFLAVPVRVLCERLAFVLPEARLITDCGSTKRAIVRAANGTPNQRRFVPGHPMAGLPDGGIAEARAELFDGRPWILCGEDADSDAVESVEQWVRRTGGAPVHLSAAAHDAAVARTSHLPQLVASALLGMVGARSAAVTGGPAFERLTRTAGGPQAMWRDIFMSNADEIAAALGELIRALSSVQAELSRGSSSAQADALLEAARQVRYELQRAGAVSASQSGE